MLRLRAAIFVLLALLAAGPAQALLVDPVNGDSGTFFWNGGVGDSVQFGSRPVGDDKLELVLTGTTQLGIFAVADCCVVGDEFILVVNDLQVAWTSESVDSDGNFRAQATGIVLPAGTHTIDLTVAVAAPGFNSGDGDWSLSAAVPEPSSALLACVGALVVHASLRRRKRVP